MPQQASKLDCGKQIKLTTSELTRYNRFRMAALIQAEHYFPQIMSDEDWMVIVAEAIRKANADADMVACALRSRGG